MKILFFSRDVRGGLGERRVFRTIFSYLAKNHRDSVTKNIAYVAEFGRYDDLLCLMDTECEKPMLDFLKEQFNADMENLKTGGDVSLLAKWLPSVNTSNKEAVQNALKIARRFGLSNGEYRKALSALRAKIKIIENNLRTRDYSFDYQKQPSRALFKYQKAFLRNDGERYKSFLEDVSNGKAKLKTDNVCPYEIVAQCLNPDGDGNCSGMRVLDEGQKKALNATWASLGDYGTDENMLAVIDTSGSMYQEYREGSPMPATVALSLGLYIAERNKGKFKNHFIEFSHKSKLIEIKGETFVDRIEYLTSFSEIANTNIESVFKKILNVAVSNRLPQEELPQKLVIISDMEFDWCVENAELSNFENAKKMFAEHGYTLPTVIFWNVASRALQVPVQKNEQGVALVSGVTPKIFSMIAGGIISPLVFMNEVLSNPRYEKITA